jgi:hypothetical protein
MAGLANYGFNIGYQDLYVPYIRKGNGWIVSLNIQNLGQIQSSPIKVILYNSDGTYLTKITINNLDPGKMYELQTDIPSNFSGSARIHSDNVDLAVAVHQAHTDGRHYGYSVP